MPEAFTPDRLGKQVTILSTCVAVVRLFMFTCAPIYLYTFPMPESKFRSFRVEAVVLRHSDYGEADRLLTSSTRQLGKTRAASRRS